MKYGWMWIVVVSACSGWTSSDPARAPAASTSLEQARAYERGAGVARDYHAAAELYRGACDSGRGSLVACDALLEAHLASRGVDASPAATRELANAVCLARRDPYACVAADLVADRKAAMAQPLRDVINDVTGDLALCDVTHASECRARLLAVEHPKPQTAPERRLRELRVEACRIGIVEGCAAIVRARHAGASEIAVATSQLQAACDAHDATACAAAPGRAPVPLRELCAASDYEACAHLGCQGDAAARQRAASHGAPTGNCRRFEPETAAQTDDVIGKMTEFKDRMCECNDKDCVDRITEDMTRWGNDVAKRSQNDSERLGEEATRHLTEITEDMTRCMTRAMTTP